MLRGGLAPAFAPFTSHRSHGFAPPRLRSARCGSLPVGIRPSCFGTGCLFRSLRSHRNAPSDYHRRYCRVCSVHSTTCRPSFFRPDKRLRSMHKHRIALLALIPLAGWLLTHSSFRTSTRPAPFAHLTLSVFMLAHSVVMLAHTSLVNSFVHFIHTAQLFNGKCFVMFVRC